jgi:hypothetical protein
MIMSNPLLRKPAIEAETVRDRYQKLGLRENPFPAEPALVVGSPDPRLNGSIYCPDLHSSNITLFRNLLVPSREGKPVRTLAFLMDHASRRGRGIGKSAFLKHQRDAIMRDLGEAASGGFAVLFAVYVVPTASPPCRKFWEFCRLIARAMCDQGVIARALWRLRAMSGAIPQDVLADIGGQDAWESTIGNDPWLQKRNVDTFFTLSRSIRDRLLGAGISEEWADYFVNHGASIPRFTDHVLGAQTDSFWRRSGGDFVFGDLVKLFGAAQFNRGLLLVDEVEKIIYHQNIQERRAFVDSLRFYMLDGSHNARVRFYGMLLTIHPGIQEILLPHWNAAGLDRLAPLNQPDAEEITLYFPPLNEEMSLPLVTVYLDNFRSSKAKLGTIKPFTREAVVEALVKSGGVPGRTLNLLNRVVEKAVELDRAEIGKDVVDSVYQASERIAAGEVVENEALPRGEARLTE